MGWLTIMTNYTWADLQPQPRYDGSQPCATIGIEAYFLENGQSHEKHMGGAVPTLKRLCSECPFFTECRQWSIHHEFYGFWGGMTSQERARFRHDNNIKYIAPEWVEGYYE